MTSAYGRNEVLTSACGEEEALTSANGEEEVLTSAYGGGDVVVIDAGRTRAGLCWSTVGRREEGSLWQCQKV